MQRIAKRDKKQTNNGQRNTHVNKTPLTAWTASQQAALTVKFKQISKQWMPEQLIIWRKFARDNRSQEAIGLVERWRNNVKPGIYRFSDGKWKKYHEPKILCGERREIEERLSEIIRRIESPAREIRNRPHQLQLQSDEYTADWQFTSPAPQISEEGSYSERKTINRAHHTTNRPHKKTSPWKKEKPQATPNWHRRY